MKELQEFNNWATTIVESSIFEAPKKNSPIKREIPQTQDIVYQATRKYPDRDENQALSLFLADKLEDFDRRDLEQNAVINAQRRENSKLNTNLTKLQQELDTIETNSEQTDSEIERLKALSGKISTDIEQRKIGARDIERALAQVEELRNKPGMSEEKYEELKKKIEAAQQNGDRINPEEFKKFTDQMSALQSEQRIEKNQLSRLEKLASELSIERQEISRARSDLASRISDLEDREKTIDQEIKNAVNDSLEKLKTKQKKYRKAVSGRSKQARTLIKNFLDKQYPVVKKQIEELLKSDAAQTDAISSLMQTDQQDTDTDIQGTAPTKLGSNIIPFLKSQKNVQTSTQSQATRNREMYTDDDVDNMPAVKSVSESRTKLKEGASPDHIDLTPEQMRWISIANEIVFKGNPQDIERLMQLLQNLPEDVFLKNFVDEANLLIEKFDRGATRLKNGLKFIIQHIESNAGRSINFQPSEDPILYSTFKSYRINWVNSKEEVLNDIRRYYRSEEKKQGYVADEPSLFPPMIGDEDDDYGAIDLTKPKSNLEESINKMVDNIIGEDVARWIK